MAWRISRGGPSRPNTLFDRRNAGEQAFQRAAELELEAAQALKHNGFKIELAKRTIVSVLTELSAKKVA